MWQNFEHGALKFTGPEDTAMKRFSGTCVFCVDVRAQTRLRVDEEWPFRFMCRATGEGENEAQEQAIHRFLGWLRDVLHDVTVDTAHRDSGGHVSSSVIGKKHFMATEVQGIVHFR